MSATNSSIEWTDVTWNPVRGCGLVSPGCTNCYAMRFAHRFSGKGKPYAGLTKLRRNGGPVWTDVARFIPEALCEPLRWRADKRVFVNSMSDLFHPDVTDDQIAAVFGVMAMCQRHTFQILTKRPERMRRWFAWVGAQCPEVGEGKRPEVDLCQSRALEELYWVGQRGARVDVDAVWPLPNVHLGVSVENQRYADERIPHLLETPAAVRWVSAEPLLEGTDLSRYLAGQWWERNAAGKMVRRAPGARLDWVVVGGESGPGARPFCLSWARNIIADCDEAGTPVFLKQLGARPYELRDDAVDDINIFDEEQVDRWLKLKDRKGGDWDEWEPFLRKRQYPEVHAQ